MPRFPVSFGRRRSTADNLDNAAAAEPSFRVLERPDASNEKSFDGGARLSNYKPTHPKGNMSVDLSPMDDNIFADLKATNRSGSGLSNNTTKSSLTDNSSRHSNVSTAPSSTTDNNTAIPEEPQRPAPNKKSYQDIPLPPIPKSASSGFLKAAGRTFSFGTKKNQHSGPANDELTMSPTNVDQHNPEQFSQVGRPRTTTTSTTSTATPPKIQDESSFDLGGDFSKMLSFDKRQSVLTLKDDQNGRQAALGQRSLTGNRLSQQQPAPLKIDRNSRIEPSPFSGTSNNSGDRLLYSPASNNGNGAPPVPKHGSAYSPRPQGPSQASSDGSLQAGHPIERRTSADADGEDTSLLKDISTATRFLKSGSGQAASGRYRRDEDTLGSGYRQASPAATSNRDDEDLFDASLVNSSRVASRFVAERPSPPRNKVMTPAEFERYRQDKEKGSDAGDQSPVKGNPDDDDDDINYEDDDDEMEKSKQAAKQRRKQEAHMTVYRQQMMKVTGEPGTTGMSHRPTFSASFSTPNLLQPRGPSPNKSAEASGDSDEDEEVPLAILAAHGFPNRNRPPHRLSTMMSNPNLKVAAQSSYARPGSVHGDSPGGASGPSPSSGRLPAFARNLPQDPFVGAGLVNPAVRESLSFGGGAPAAHQTPGVPPGGLVGVIAGEERARAMRRGSPAIDGNKPMMPMSGPSHFDSLGAVPSHMMYPGAAPRPLSTVEQTQAQMNQMQQFMQMQMQFMQMQMMQTNGNRMSQMPQMPPQMPGMLGGQMPGTGMMGSPADMRHSFIDNGSMFDLPVRPEQHGRSMSMVQPSSASWIQPPVQGPGYAPSIRIQGAGYAPSIAPSERSNVGLPGRYRPVSHMPAPNTSESRKSTIMSGSLGWDQQRSKSPLGFGTSKTPSPGPEAAKNNKKTIIAVAADEEDEDDEQGWAAMKQKREKKRSLWKSKKSFGSEIAMMIK